MLDVARPPSEVSPGAWTGLRVIDLSEHRAGQFASRLMADAGADVVLVEPVTGSSIRRTPPFWSRGRRPEDSITFWHLNAGKRSVTLDLAQRTGQRLLSDLARGADVVVAAHRSTGARTVEDASALLCWVDDFGQSSAFAHWRGSELVHQAMSGVMFESGSASDRPLYGCGHRSYAATGTAAYVASTAALMDADPRDRVREVAVNVSEVAPSMNHCTGTHYWYNGTFDSRGAQISPTMMIQCSDGWVVTFPSAPRWRATCRSFGATELADDPRFADERSRLHRWPAIQAELQASCASLTCAEVVAAAERENAIITRVANPHELWSDEHLRARGFWQSVDDGDVDRPALPPAFKVAVAQRPAARRPPRLGEHTRDELAAVGVTDDEYDFLRGTGMA